MQQTYVWKRVFLGVVIIVLLVFPVLIYILRSPKITTLLPVIPQLSGSKVLTHSYSAKSELPTHSLTLVDSQYLEYVTSNLHVFGPQAIIDPRVYQGFSDIKTRYTVKSIQFILVNSVEKPVGVIVEGGGKIPFAMVGQGIYSIDGTVLTIRVALNMPEIQKSMTRKFSLEDVYLRTAVNTLYYALGVSDPKENQSSLLAMKKQIEDYLYTGVFQWPLRIERL
jgi:hypothetical protein